MISVIHATSLRVLCLICAHNGDAISDTDFEMLEVTLLFLVLALFITMLQRTVYSKKRTPSGTEVMLGQWCL